MIRRVRQAMGNGPTLRRFAPLLPVLALGACTSVLGIEDIQEDRELANGGTSTTTDVAGGTKNTGGSKSGSSSGGNGNVGGDEPVGGDASNGGTPAAGGTNPVGGDGGMAGAPDPVDPTVQGRVIDFWGKALSGVPVQIGEVQVITNAQGQFTFEDVPAEYDVSLVVRPKSPDKDFGWVYQGLTRRDPTLQVYQGRDERSAEVLTKVSNVMLGASDTITVAFGTPDGSYQNTSVSALPAGEWSYPSWVGGTSTTGNAHALWWTNNDATDLPSSYKAYVTKPVGLFETVDGDETFDLTPSTIAIDTVSGTATPALEDDRQNTVFVRFGSSATIQLVDQSPGAPDTFSYVVPKLANSSITVAAREGYYYGPTGLAHGDGLTPGDNSIALDIPAPAEPLSPVGGSANSVTKDTNFTFKSSASNKGAFVVVMENQDYYQTLYIVTSKKQFKIPVVAGSVFELDPAQLFYWRVETHGDFATVDQMVGASGFMDAFSFDWETPMGPKQESGSFTMSGGYPFTTAP
jgi:hypothetical protein